MLILNNNGNLDGINTVTFGDVGDTGVIAVTNVWGYFSGPVQLRELVEWDMLLNDASFTFGDATLDASKMDFLNIFTHEQGHSTGLNDQYSGSCSLVTMYGYSTEGEIIKRTLESPDIKGIQTLYT